MRLLLLAAVLLAGPAWADDDDTTINFDGGYRTERELNSNVPATGYGVGLTIGLDQFWSIGGNYSQLQTDQFDDAGTGLSGRNEYTAVGASLGLGIPITRRAAFGLSAGYVSASTEGIDAFGANPAQRFHGPSGSLSLSYRLFNGVMFSAGPAYSYVGAEPAWNGSATLGLRFAKWLWVDTSYWRSKVSDGWGVGLRTDFH